MPKQERSIRTRDLLLEEGLSALIRQGYNGTGIKEVLDNVGVPKGSFYNYFDSKDDFGAQVIDLYSERRHAELDGALDGSSGALDGSSGALDGSSGALDGGPGALNGSPGALDGGPGALDRLRAYFEAEISRQLETGAGCLLGNLGAEVGATNPVLQRAMKRGMRGTLERFTRVISQAQEEGTVRVDRSAEELGGVVFAAWEGALIRMQVEGDRAPLDEFGRLIIGDFLNP